MSLHVLAHHMASKGRGGDSMLVHMTPGEVETLQKMAEKLGGSLTINPETGLPEASFLGNLFKAALPMIAGFALAPLTAGTSLAFLGATPLASALTVGGISGLATGSLSKGLMAGIGAYGGASLGASFANAGTSSLIQEGVQNSGLLSGATGQSLDVASGAFPNAFGQGASSIAENVSNLPTWDKMSAGWDVAKANPLDFAKANKGPLALAGLSFAAGQEPAKLDIPTTTQSPAMIRPMHQTRERILPGDPDYRTNEAGSQIGYFRTKYTTPEPYVAAASGGIVALADGGMTDEQLSSIGTYLATNPSASDLSAAMQQFGVSQSDVDLARSRMAPSPSASSNAFTVGAGQQTGQQNNTQEGMTPWMQSMAQAGQGVQWGSGQSEAALVEQARSQGWSPEHMAKAMGVPVDTISGAYQRYDLGIGRDKELAQRQAQGTNVSSSPWGGFNAATASENYATTGSPLGNAPAPQPSAAPSPFTVGGNQQADEQRRREEYLSATQQLRAASGQAPNTGIFTGAGSVQGSGADSSAYLPSMFEQYGIAVPENAKAAYKAATGQDYKPGSSVTGFDAKSGKYTVNESKAPASGIQTLAPKSSTASSQNTTTQSSSGQDLSGTVAGAFVGPNGTVITYDNTGKQTDTGRPASALNDYLTDPQESNVGAFVRGLSWGVSPEEDAKSARKLYDYAKSRGLSSSELLKQSGLEGTGVTAQGLDAQWAQWNVAPIKPVDPYDPGSPIVTPPPGKAPIPAPSTPKNPQLPPGWTGVDKTPIPTRAPAPGGVAALTTLTGDPYGLTPTATKFVPPTRTGRSKEIYDYLSGKTSTAPTSTRKPIEAKAPAPASSTSGSESAAPKSPDPAQQPTITSIYDFIHTLNWGTPEADAISTPKLSAQAAKNGWSIEQLSTASGFSVAALRAMFDKYGVSTPPPAASPAPPPEQGGGYAYGGMTKMAGGGLGSLGGYSDGGQLLRGPGDGVSDHIPATIGDKQPARLADGEFVVPARIVSELGNGSTEAGARSLYRMMDRVQEGRSKSIGKGKVAVNSRAEKYLPA